MFDLLQLAEPRTIKSKLCWFMNIVNIIHYCNFVAFSFYSRCILACCLAFVVRKRVAKLMALISVLLKWQKSPVFQVLMNKWNLWSSYPAMQEFLKGCSSMTSFVLGPRKYVRRSVACVIQMLKLISLCSARGGRYLLTNFRGCGKCNIMWSLLASFCTISAGLYVSGVFRIHLQFKFEPRSINSTSKGSLYCCISS